MNYYGVLIFFVLSTALSQTPPIWPTALHNPFMSNDTAGSMRSVLIPLRYVDPKELVTILKDQKAQLVSAQTVFVVQEKEHTVWAQGTAADIQTIKNLVTGIDQPRRQLLLKARIVNVDNNFIRDLGVLFESSPSAAAAPAHFENNSVSPGNALGSFTIPIANLKDGYLLDVKLNALEKAGHATVVSSPELVTLDHDAAVIESGEEIPYQQEALNGGTAISFKKAVLKLQVTPYILPNKHILLDVSVNQDKVSLLTVQGVPAIHTQQLSTQIEVKNRQTFVLGGVYEEGRSDQKQGVPYLKNIPMLGYLFRTYRHVNEQRDMLIFVTVEVI